MSSDDAASAHHELVGINSFLACLVVLLCLTLGGLLQRYEVHQLPSSGASMLFGAALGLILNAAPRSEQTVLAFNAELFFFVLLPPIIFDAGYRLQRKKRMFYNLGSIATYAVVGTLATCLSFGYLLYFFAYFHLIPLDSNSPLECLLFGAVISATDPVATMSMLNSRHLHADRLFHSLVFGESVLNDAIAIVLYKVFGSALNQTRVAAQNAAAAAASAASARGEDADAAARAAAAAVSAASSNFTFWTLSGVMVQFLITALGSIVVGLGVGLLCSWIVKQLRFTAQPVHSEYTVVFLFAYLSYAMAESLALSGIASIFITSLTLAHYCHHSLSAQAQIVTREGFASLAQIAETSVFAYVGVTLGLSVGSSLGLKWHGGLCLIVVVACLAARAMHIFPLTAVLNLGRTTRIPMRMQTALWLAGGSRGSVAFALAVNFTSESARPYVVTSVLVLVLFSSLVIGSLTLPVLRATGMTLDEDEALQQQQQQQLNSGSEQQQQQQQQGGGASVSSPLNHNAPRTSPAAGECRFELLSDQDKSPARLVLESQAHSPTPPLQTSQQQQRDLSAFTPLRPAATAATPSTTRHRNSASVYEPVRQRLDARHNWLSEHWHRFDARFLQPIFGGVQTEHALRDGLGTLPEHQQLNHNNALHHNNDSRSFLFAASPSHRAQQSSSMSHAVRFLSDDEDEEMDFATSQLQLGERHSQSISRMQSPSRVGLVNGQTSGRSNGFKQQQQHPATAATSTLSPRRSTRLQQQLDSVPSLPAQPPSQQRTSSAGSTHHQRPTSL